MEDGSSPSRRRRTPQACNTCRRRKTKCDGIRPTCRHCSARRISCVWPSPVIEPSIHAIPTPDGSDRTHRTLLPSPVPALASSVSLPDRRVLRRCYDKFFEYHFSGNFCSFLFRPDLEGDLVDSPFLSSSILCLCSRYFTAHEASQYFGLPSGLEVCRLYTPVAREYARATSDEPNVRNIQGNLVLALSEFVNNEGSSHWMYAGTAIRMAQIMRLNKEYHQSHSLKEQEIRRRTLWACLFMDKMLAFFLTKPPTLALVNISVALPGTDASLAYQEPTRGLKLDNIGSFAGFPSEIGILPYLVKTLCLFGDVIGMNVNNYRFIDKLAPTDPASQFLQRHEEMRAWSEALPPSLQWSEQNYANHAGLGHGKDFVAIHFLIRGAFCTTHQSYLPQLDGSSILLNAVDAAGWSLLHREPGLITTCVRNALETATMASHLFDASAKARSDLQSVWVAASLFSVANTLLWLQYSNDPLYSDVDTISRAEKYFNLVLDIMTPWVEQWRAAQQWLNMLRAMRAMYRAAYLGEVDETVLNELATISSDGDSPSRYRPRPGDGFPSLDVAPSLNESLRFLASDTSAEPKRLHSVWMQLAGGWPLDFLGGMTPATDSLT